MKTLLFPFIFCFIWSQATLAQRPITVREDNVTFKHGTIPGFLVTIPEVSYKKVEGTWLKLLEKGTKSKVQNDEGELTIFGALIKEIGGAPINVYSYVKDMDTVILLAASFEVKKNEYVATGGRNEETVKTRDFLMNFARDHYLELAKEQLDVEEKKLSKLEGLLKSLENEKNKLEKMIQSNNTNIASTNDQLVILRTNLTSLNDEMLAQNNEFNAMEEGDAKAEKKKYIDDLGKQIKKTNKDIESGEKKVINMTAEIEKAQVDTIPNNLKEQEQTRKAIDEQREVANAYRAKYNNIKNYK